MDLERDNDNSSDNELVLFETRPEIHVVVGAAEP